MDQNYSRQTTKESFKPLNVQKKQDLTRLPVNLNFTYNFIRFNQQKSDNFISNSFKNKHFVQKIEQNQDQEKTQIDIHIKQIKTSYDDAQIERLKQFCEDFFTNLTIKDYSLLFLDQKSKNFLAKIFKLEESSLQKSDKVVKKILQKRISLMIKFFIQKYHNAKRLNFMKKLFHIIITQTTDILPLIYSEYVQQDCFVNFLFNNPNDYLKQIIISSLKEFKENSAIFLFSFDVFRNQFQMALESFNQVCINEFIKKLQINLKDPNLLNEQVLTKELIYTISIIYGVKYFRTLIYV